MKSAQTGAVQKELDIQEYTDPEHNPMIPHTLVLKPGGYWFWAVHRVARIHKESDNVTSFVLAAIEGQHLPVFQAGQFVVLPVVRKPASCFVIQAQVLRPLG